MDGWMNYVKTWPVLIADREKIDKTINLILGSKKYQAWTKKKRAKTFGRLNAQIEKADNRIRTSKAKRAEHRRRWYQRKKAA